MSSRQFCNVESAMRTTKIMTERRFWLLVYATLLALFAGWVVLDVLPSERLRMATVRVWSACSAAIGTGKDCAAWPPKRPEDRADPWGGAIDCVVEDGGVANAISWGADRMPGGTGENSDTRCWLSSKEKGHTQCSCHEGAR